MRKLLSVLIVTTGCSQNVYSPPSQAYALGPIHTLKPGRQAVDVELSRHAQIFDPAINAGGARLRVGSTDNTEISIEGAALAVEDGGPSTADRRLYMGRAGVRTNPNASDGKSGASFFAGAGGGYAPAGGTFASVDAGLAIGYENCVLVPVLQASAFVSEPLAARPIDVSVNETMETDTPKRTIGGVLRGGLRLALAPSACRRGEQIPWLSLGVGATSLADADSSAGLGGIGLGFEIPL